MAKNYNKIYSVEMCLAFGCVNQWNSLPYGYYGQKTVVI